MQPPFPFDPLDSNSRLVDRLNRFMQDPSPYDARKRHEIFAVELRSRQRSDQLYKRRLDCGAKPLGSFEVSRALGAAKPVLEDQGVNLDIKLMALKEVLAGASSSLKADVLQCLAGVINNEQAHDLICANGTVPLLKECLTSPHAQIVKDSTSIFVGLTAGSSRVNFYLIDQGVVEALLRTISAHNKLATMNAVWAFANILVDTTDVATLLLNKNFLTTLQSVLEWYPTDGEIWQAAAYCLSLVCCERMSIADSKQVVNLLKRLMTLQDKEILRDAMRALEMLSKGDDLQIKSVFDPLIIDFLINGLKSQDSDTRRHSVIAVTTITATSPEVTQHLLVCNILDFMKASMRSSDYRERVGVLMCLGNIAAEGSTSTSQLMSHNIMYDAVGALMDTAETVRAESLIFFEELVMDLSFEQRLKLVYVHDIFRPLSFALSMAEPTGLVKLISLSSMLLEASEGESSKPSAGTPVKDLFESSGCLDEINRIAVRAAKEVYLDAFQLLETHFSESESDALNAPVTEGTFNFS